MKKESFKRMEKEKSHRRRSGSPEGKPAHFFKFILPTTILDKKLRIPMEFVEDHGDDFSSIVTLTDPNLREWKIGLEKSENDVWFCDGWQKFMEYYSITYPKFLVFRYEGNSNFHVLIFDMSGSEISYPENRNPNTEVHEDDVISLESSENNDRDYQWDNAHNNDHCHYTDDVEEEDYTDHEDHGDDSTDEDDDDFAACYSSSSASKSPPPCSPKGRGFTKFIDQRSERERDRERDRDRDRRREKEYSPSPRFGSQRKRKRQVSESEYSESDEEEGGGGSRRSKGGKCYRCREGRYGYRVKKKESVEWVLKSKNYKKRKISSRERDLVMRAAREFKSEFPSFRSVLRPHNLYNSFVYVPARFAMKYLDGRSEIIRLESSNGRKQWLARCLNRNGSGGGKSIGKGWAKFVMDNHLQEGDVSVFELVKRKNIVLRVKTFRVSDYADR